MATKKAGARRPSAERVRQMGAKLQASSKALNAYLEAAENQLAEYGLIADVHVDLGVEVEDSHGYSSYALCFERAKNTKPGWGFVLRTYDSDGSLNNDAQPLPNASRKMRIAAAKAMPKLIDRLLDEVEKQNEELNEALRAIGSVIDAPTPAIAEILAKTTAPKKEGIGSLAPKEQTTDFDAPSNPFEAPADDFGAGDDDKIPF